MIEIHLVKKVHEGEDYTRYSYEDHCGKQEIEITGGAQYIVNALLKRIEELENKLDNALDELDEAK